MVEGLFEKKSMIKFAMLVIHSVEAFFQLNISSTEPGVFANPGTLEIRKPSFAQLHQTTRASNQAHFLIPCRDPKTSKVHIFSAPLDEQKFHLTPPTHILTLPEPGSCFEFQSLNGLHCINSNGNSLNPVYIFNANTRQVITLPNVPDVLAINDRSSVTCTYHFGFDPQSYVKSESFTSYLE
ncbi:F-box protein [Quillaja saponaria]|uniref:F-box protein n=1 Tax=Quillaja saponaria TaxID=32244 RepID=A0AAD7LA29_QUISA|nr:F-box protein [Quillaja saponaria]